MNERNGLAFLIGFIIGGLVGAAIALLFAPYPGEETRARLREKGIELKARAGEVAEEARRRAGELREKGVERIKEAIASGKEAAVKKKEELLAKLEAEKRAEVEA
jgi:gas vesicle protein